MDNQIEVFSQALLDSLGKMQQQWNIPRSGPSSDSERAITTSLALMRQAVLDARNAVREQSDV